MQPPSGGFEQAPSYIDGLGPQIPNIYNFFYVEYKWQGREILTCLILAQSGFERHKLTDHEYISFIFLGPLVAEISGPIFSVPNPRWPLLGVKLDLDPTWGSTGGGHFVVYAMSRLFV